MNKWIDNDNDYKNEWWLGRLLEAQIFFDAYGTQSIIHLPEKPHSFK